MKYQKQIIFWVGVFIVIILAYVAVVVHLIPLSEQNANSLAIGNRSIVESLNISITAGLDLDNLSRGEIYDLRRQAVMEFPWLIYTNYDPSKAVFGSIKDDLPWWGNAGRYYYGSGQMGADGISKDALEILNPYLLVSAEFSGLSIHTADTSGSFWSSNFSSAALQKPGFPYRAIPENLRWWPERSRAEVTYNLTGYLSELNHWTAAPKSIADAKFDLIALNARDLNMNYIWVDYGKSINITKDGEPDTAAGITQHFQRSNDCGLPGGCNDLDASMPDIQGLQIRSLPAKLIICLWSERPAAVTDTPDLTYVINLK